MDTARKAKEELHSTRLRQKLGTPKKSQGKQEEASFSRSASATGEPAGAGCRGEARELKEFKRD